MNTGEILSAAHGAPSEPQPTWIVGECLGRGTWGRSFLVRSGDGQERVLKVPLGPGDFPADTPVPASVLKACRDALEEQARLLTQGTIPFLPRLEARLTLPDGRPALLMPRYGTSLARRMESGLPLTQALMLVQRICGALAALGRAHGNLRPSNILLNDRGEPVLADMLTPAAERALEALEALTPHRSSWRPPEARGRATGMWDTWALCQVLWQAAMTRDAGGGVQRLDVPADGLDKVAVATLKDRALARLSGERANARFRARLTDRLGALLNRGLSRPAEPSPPYRFVDAADLLPRLEDVTALIAPRVDEVGRILLGTDADASGTFLGGGAVSFAVSVGCSPGVVDHEDVVCGLQLVDLDAPDGARVPLTDAKFAVSSHPSGRLRFQFDIPRIPPGRYRVRAAFTIKDSGHEPQVADGRFEVRPPPGYVPPAEPEAPATISFDRGRARVSVPIEEEEDAETTVDAPSPPKVERPRPVATASSRGQQVVPRLHGPGPAPDAELRDESDRFDPTLDALDPASDISDPGAEIIEGLFPKPLAPPEEDLLPEPAEPVTPRAPAPVLVEVEVEETEAGYATGGGGSARRGGPQAPRGLGDPPTGAGSAGPVAFAGGHADAIGHPRPAIAMPPPQVRPSAPSAPLPRAPSPPRVAAAPHRDGPAVAEVELDDDGWDLGADDWAALSSDATDFGIEHEALPLAEGEDLPSWRQGDLRFDARKIPGVARLVELVQRDSYTAFVAAVAASFVLLLACMALIRAC